LVRAEPVQHNVLPTLATARLSADLPLSGDERFVRMVEVDRRVSGSPGPGSPGPGPGSPGPGPGPGQIVLDPGCSGIRKPGGHYIHGRA
jgi:hypothetical protein